jgi:hypothetical protein
MQVFLFRTSGEVKDKLLIHIILNWLNRIQVNKFDYIKLQIEQNNLLTVSFLL